MIQAAAACIHSEESRRPDIDEIIDMLSGRESDSIYTKKNILPGNSCLIDSYNHSQQTRSEMKSHLALAMLGVAEFDNDDLYRSWNKKGESEVLSRFPLPIQLDRE